ncbi:MAG TPA: tRNA lysidine(34) synthetase TilS [Clostridia bacterium]|nr:tRNA lysidine(34) synthetase TilS [Clostridia bacterium]
MNITDNFVKQFQHKVYDNIRTYGLISEGESVLAGVSGGPDSVCLLHVLHSLSDILHIKLYAIHINHMLRGAEANADEAYAADLCGQLSVPFHVSHEDVAALAKERGISVEEAGREARYREFERYSKAVGASKIAVAHNRNDQAETVMMHIIRGTGTTGLVGMEHIRGNIIRPLLDTSRADIERYCLEAGLKPRTDSSNLTEDYTRNKIRLGLFPYINEHFGVNMTESLCRLSDNASEDSRYLDTRAHEAYEKAARDVQAGKVELDLTLLRKMDTAVRRRVLKMAVEYSAGSSKGVGSVHYRMLSGLITGGGTGSCVELPNGVRAVLSYGVLKVFAASSETGFEKQVLSFSHMLNIPGTTLISELNAEITAAVVSADNIDKCETLGYNPLVQYFDYTRLSRGINIRNRKNGDIFKPIKSNGTRKLKEYFIDIKIPREERDGIPLVCAGNEVIWVVGYKISDKFKVTENTKSILKLEYSRRN